MSSKQVERKRRPKKFTFLTPTTRWKLRFVKIFVRKESTSELIVTVIYDATASLNDWSERFERYRLKDYWYERLGVKRDD